MKKERGNKAAIYPEVHVNGAMAACVEEVNCEGGGVR